MDINQKAITRSVGRSLERLLTYWEEDDLCEMQGQFFYYKDGTSNLIYCESEFGELRDFGTPLKVPRVEIPSIKELTDQGIIHAGNRGDLF